MHEAEDRGVCADSEREGLHGHRGKAGIFPSWRKASFVSGNKPCQTPSRERLIEFRSVGSWLVQFVLVDGSAFHHKLHFLQFRDVLQRVAGDCDEVRPFSCLDGSRFVAPAEQLRGG